MDQELSDAKRAKSIAQAKRQYGCPCGKTYLSYPALFTHVKQKHNGKAPGKLIKPKAQKARGRPKIHVDIDDNDIQDEQFSLDEDIERTLENIKIDYKGEFEIAGEGDNCQNMASQFLTELSYIDEMKKKILYCFLNQLKFNVNKKYGENHWNENHPGEIIDIVNDLCRNHETRKQQFPLDRQILIQLLFILFKWMYKRKWTDHKLLKRNNSTVN